MKTAKAFLFCAGSFAVIATTGWCAEVAAQPLPRTSYWTSTGQNLKLEKPPEIPFLERQALFNLLKAQKPILFLDVREVDEFEKKHLPNAINVPFSTRQESFEKLKKQTDKILVPYCNWDFRAYVAALDMKQAGLQNIRMLYPHGLRGWIASGFPVAGKEAGQLDTQAWDVLLAAIEKPAPLTPPSPSRGEGKGEGERISVSLELVPTKANPAHINASVGDTLILEVIGHEEDHWFVIPDFGVNLRLNPGQRQTVELPITRAGYFPYGCITCCERYHCQTKQAILVDLPGDLTHYGE